jgi:hypothetical protein
MREDRFLKRLRKKARKGLRGWPIATIAFYGPNLSQATKVAVGIVPSENAEVEELRDWKVDYGDVRADPGILSGRFWNLSSSIEYYLPASPAAVREKGFLTRTGATIMVGTPLSSAPRTDPYAQDCCTRLLIAEASPSACAAAMSSLAKRWTRR